MKNRIKSDYETMPHGSSDFHMAVFSERVYEAPLHHHSEYAIFYLAEGKMDFGINDDTYELSAGDIIFIEPYMPYYALYNKDRESFHYYSILFGEEMLGAENDPCSIFMKDCRINRFLSLSDTILSYLPQIFTMIEDDTYGREFLMKTLLFNIFAHIVNTGQYMRLFGDGNFNKTAVSQAVNCVITYIDEHYKEAITLDMLLEKISYSKSHLMRIFKKQTGMNIIDYVNKVRIDRACLELIYTNKSATEIALNNGFNTVQYFTRQFKLSIGCTPIEYRRFSRRHTNVEHIPGTEL